MQEFCLCQCTIFLQYFCKKNEKFPCTKKMFTDNNSKNNKVYQQWCLIYELY